MFLIVLILALLLFFFFFSSRRRHTRLQGDWSSDVCSSDLLSAAERCFARHGFAGTTTKSVAAAAAISEGLLFKHFPSKSALYAEILLEACRSEERRVGKECRARGGRYQ